LSAALAALSARAGRDARAVALGDGNYRLGVQDTLGWIDAVADRLRRAGVRVLAIAGDNSPDWIVTDLAAQRAGIPVVPLAPFFSAEQVEHVLRDSGADAIAADEMGSVSLSALPTRFGGELTERFTLLRVDSGAERPALHPGTAKISYTSGTTGTPKGVCLARQTLDRVAVGIREATRDLPIERHLCLLPLATLLENVAGVYGPMLAGAQVIAPSLATTGLAGAAGFNLSRLLESINRFRPHSIILLPQLLSALVAAVEQGAMLPESLRFAAVGGGVVGLPLLERADRAGIPVFEGYGLTECGSVVALNTPAARRAGSVGRPLSHCCVRIGEGSEVLVRGSAMQGYLGDDPVADGEIATGDIGHLDQDGFLHISGRRKNVLITSFGRNISPEWVEARLTAVGSIAQAALFGDARPWNVAVVVPLPHATLQDVEHDIARVNASLPDYARVRRWLLAAESFTAEDGTATANGRLRRAAIERRYRDEIEACYAESIESFA